MPDFKIIYEKRDKFDKEVSNLLNNGYKLVNAEHISGKIFVAFLGMD